MNDAFGTYYIKRKKGFGAESFPNKSSNLKKQHKVCRPKSIRNMTCLKIYESTLWLLRHKLNADINTRGSMNFILSWNSCANINWNLPHFNNRLREKNFPRKGSNSISFPVLFLVTLLFISLLCAE